MSIYISTNLFAPDEMENVFLLLEELNDKSIGLELLPEWHNHSFQEALNKNMPRLKKYKSSLHGPYYMTEHSKEKGSSEHEKAMEYFMKTLELSKELKSKYIVYHHNNCKIEPESRWEMIINSTQNLLELTELAKQYGVDVVVENAGVVSCNNMLFDQEEFICMAKNMQNNVLIDVGHAFANGWNLEYVMEELSDKIVAYHIHNNDGINDSHNRIRDGKLDMDVFFENYRKYTPEADLVIEYGRQCRADIDGMAADIVEIRGLAPISNK